jgi:hypothetical protein
LPPGTGASLVSPAAPQGASSTQGINQNYCYTQNGQQTCGTVKMQQTQTCSIVDSKQTNCSIGPLISQFCTSDGNCTNGLPPGYLPPPLFANNSVAGAQASAPINPCNKSPTPLVLRPNPGVQATTTPSPLPPPPNTGMIHLRPAEPQPPVVPASVALIGPANTCAPKLPTANVTTPEPSPKKKDVEKKPPQRSYSNNNAANNAANAAEAAAAASAIIGIVGAFGHHHGGGGGGNPCH